jgi:hypothetical protein
MPRLKARLSNGDDLENDEAVESPDQRKKLEKWFFKALMKIGQKDTVFIILGTSSLRQPALESARQARMKDEISGRHQILESKLWENGKNNRRYLVRKEKPKEGPIFASTPPPCSKRRVPWPELAVPTT